VKKFDKLILRNLSKSFGALKVLNDFDLVVENGEFITLLGPSGCGKSTALNCISGLQQVSGGEILIDDECLDDAGSTFVPPEKRGFGIVFQNYALFPHLNVYKNVAFGLELMRMPRPQIDARVRDALAMVHLEEYPTKFPTQLSGGQQQRVAIARCAVLEPRLLLLDEPLSNLDAKLRVEMRYEIKKVHERLGISTIYVTHDQQEALALSDRIVVLRIGEVQQIGTPEAIYKSPANEFVADFMGFKNIWPAKVERLVENGKIWDIVVDVNGIRLTSRRDTSAASSADNALIAEAYRKREELVTAIRPEDFLVGAAAANVLRGSVDLVEYLGTICQTSALLSNGLRITARHAQKLTEGEPVTYNIPPDRILVFPKQKGGAA
jgi:putative spermidine/putrescine transport system ATP-binding protein